MAHFLGIERFLSKKQVQNVLSGGLWLLTNAALSQCATPSFSWQGLGGEVYGEAAVLL